MIFQSLGLIVPHDVLDIVYDQYTIQENLQLYNTSSSSVEINNNNSKLNISKEDWINLVENCLLQELKNQERKRIENILKTKMQLKEENDKNERRNNYLYNDNDFDDVHNDDNYDDEINRQKANFNSSEKKKNGRMKMKKQKQSHSLSAVRGTENSMRRSVSTTPQYVHTEGTMDPYSVCDRRARSFSAPRGRVFGAGDRDGGRDWDGGRYMDEIRMRVKKGERGGREDDVEWKEEGEGDVQGRGGRQPYPSTVHRIRSSSAGATGRSTGVPRRPSPRASDHGLFFGPGLGLGSGSCHRAGTGAGIVMGTGTGGKGFISSFTRGGMKNRVGHYNHRQQKQLHQHHNRDINQKHDGKKHDKQERRSIPFYNNVEFKVLSPLNRPSRTQQNKNTTLIDNKEVSEQPFNDSETSYSSPSLLNRKRASELARIR